MPLVFLVPPDLWLLFLFNIVLKYLDIYISTVFDARKVSIYR